MTNPVAPEIPRVNLLDPECEPSDEQLDAIMRAVMVDVRERAARADAALRATLDREVKTAWTAHLQRTGMRE